MFKILFCIFLFLSFCFGAFEKELEYFDSNFLSSNYNTQMKFHHQLKNLYIQSVINEDEKSKIEILKRLIVSSNVLNLDDENYINELKQSGINEKNINTLKQSFTQEVKVQNAIFSPNNPNNDEKLLVAATKESSKKIYILNSKKISTGIELRLDSKLEKENIKSFILDEKNNFRYIMDFEAALEGGKRDFKFDDFSITLSQYNPKTTRIVVRAKEKVPINLNLNEKNLTILVNQTQTNPKNSKEEVKKEPSQVLAKNSQKEEKGLAVAQKDTQTQKNEEKPIYVLKTTKSSSGIDVNLNKALSEDKLSISSSKTNKLFRKIISFEGILEGGAKNFNFGQNFITITQFNPKIVRIVL
ncbi:MAG: AMIN domain-containing protein, partial [Campylobacter sp.]|nr:AMIN domain-containing protein [Campylobacter sp.]